MRTKRVLAGSVHGSLLVVSDVTTYSLHRVYARCVCGRVRSYNASHVFLGKTSSCGCLKASLCRVSKLRHGFSGTQRKSCREYSIWLSMRTRCRNPKAANYARYGGLGVEVCDRWNDFLNFYNDMGPAPSQAHTLDRIDSAKNYEPSNCRWATVRQQSQNRKNVVPLTAFGKTQRLSEWAEERSLCLSTICKRLKRGASPEQALQTS
jgi:hypothetical protein